MPPAPGLTSSAISFHAGANSVNAAVGPGAGGAISSFPPFDGAGGLLTPAGPKRPLTGAAGPGDGGYWERRP